MGIFETYYKNKGLQLDEAVKKVGEHKNGNKHATVHRDAENDEYRVKFHTDGVHHKDADYHTGDKDDAHSTAKHWIGNKVNEEVLDESSVLIEYIQELEEKLAVFTKGSDKTKDEYTKSRGTDARKTEPQVATVRKDAADKIRAARKKSGSSAVKHDHENFSIHKT